MEMYIDCQYKSVPIDYAKRITVIPLPHHVGVVTNHNEFDLDMRTGHRGKTVEDNHWLAAKKEATRAGLPEAGGFFCF
jgi:hypothetical protein